MESFFQYNFESERKAIVEYEKNKVALVSKKESSPPPGTGAVPEEPEIMIIERPSDVIADKSIKRIHSNAILEPSRATVTSQQVSN